MSAKPQHKLQHAWTLWCDKKWSDLTEVCSFDSIETFWGIFDNVAPPTSLPHMQNLRLFHKGIHPSQEDPVHVNGGKWIVQFYRNTDIDRVWLNLLMDLVGCLMDQKFEVTGVELNIRNRGHRISFWTRNRDEYQKSFGEYLARECGLSVVNISFKVHEQIQKSKSCFTAESVWQFKN